MRIALLGSPGIGIPYRPVFQLSGAGVSVTGAAATYAAVVALHVLVISFPNTSIPNVTVTFTGLEAAQADFLLAINAQSQGRFIAVNAAGQIKLIATQLGSMSSAAVAAGTSADVLASLGLVVGAFGTAATAVRGPYGKFAQKYAGGAVHQRLVFIPGMQLDHNAAITAFSDNVQQTPNPLA